MAEIPPRGCVKPKISDNGAIGEAAEAILVAHQRRDYRGCLCGWSELGRSHPGHQVAMLREAGVLEDQESAYRAGREDAAKREADLLEMAWCIIANADVRTLDERDDEWAAAARRWRGGYHEWLRTWVKVGWCNWCPDPGNPSPIHHPGGSVAHLPAGEDQDTPEGRDEH